MKTRIFTQASFDKLTNEQIITRIKGYQEMAEIYFRITGDSDNEFTDYANEFIQERDRRIEYLSNN